MFRALFQRVHRRARVVLWLLRRRLAAPFLKTRLLRAAPRTTNCALIGHDTHCSDTLSTSAEEECESSVSFFKDRHWRSCLRASCWPLLRRLRMLRRRVVRECGIAFGLTLKAV